VTRASQVWNWDRANWTSTSSSLLHLLRFHSFWISWGHAN